MISALCPGATANGRPENRMKGLLASHLLFERYWTWYSHPMHFPTTSTKDETNAMHCNPSEFIPTWWYPFFWEPIVHELETLPYRFFKCSTNYWSLKYKRKHKLVIFECCYCSSNNYRVGGSKSNLKSGTLAVYFDTLAWWQSGSSKLWPHHDHAPPSVICKR